MTALLGTTKAQPAMEIPPLTHAEAGTLAQTEYERVLSLLEQVEGAEWAQPTYCTAWNVRQMVAHLAGSVTGSTTLAEFLRQNVTNPHLKEVSDPVDAINRLQLDERAARTPAELVEEFRCNGQIAVDNRRNLPWLLRQVHLPMGTLGFAPIEYLTDTIYVRDQWMHRYDICAATGNRMVVTPEHDGRIVALVIRDIAKKLKASWAQHPVTLHLSGEISGTYCFGSSATAACRLDLDFFDFNLRASGRITAAEALNRSRSSGNPVTATWFLDHMEVPY
jgi:uncharacterized protein (TIGR03083 family)